MKSLEWVQDKDPGTVMGRSLSDSVQGRVQMKSSRVLDEVSGTGYRTKTLGLHGYGTMALGLVQDEVFRTGRRTKPSGWGPG